MVLWIVCRWRDVFTITVAAEVEEHAAELDKLPGYEPPHAAVAAVAVQAEQGDCARG